MNSRHVIATAIFLDHATTVRATFPALGFSELINRIIRLLCRFYLGLVATAEVGFGPAGFTGLSPALIALSNSPRSVARRNECAAIISPAVQTRTWVGQLFHLSRILLELVVRQSTELVKQLFRDDATTFRGGEWMTGIERNESIAFKALPAVPVAAKDVIYISTRIILSTDNTSYYLACWCRSMSINNEVSIIDML